MSFNLLRWLPAFRDMDYEQQAVVSDSLKTGGMLVYGPAGSGKTAIALYCGKTLSDLGKSFRVFVYTNVLMNFIKAGASDLQLPSDCVTTFYRWARQQHQLQIGYPPDTGEDKFSLWVDNLIRHWSRYPGQVPHYDYVLVDEAQDFKDNVARLLHMISPNILVVADPSQSLYMDTKDRTMLVQRWSPLSGHGEIPNNYRNPRSVARVAALFLDPAVSTPTDFVRRVKGRAYEGKPVWYQVVSIDEQTDRICELVEEARGSVRIGILHRRRQYLEQEQIRLKRRGVRVQVALSASSGYDFNDPAPVLTTAHSAKGLEFDWVILPSLNDYSWNGDANDRKERNLFFVALTRTKERLYLISRKGSECAFLKEILEKDPDSIQSPLASSPLRSFASSIAPNAFDNDDDPF